MTDYSTMPDDDLDALVAARVMGWQAWSHDRDGPWRPSLYWSDAGRVLEKMREGGWLWMTEQTAKGHCGYVRAGVGDYAHSTATTVLRAICIAALRAVEQGARP